ncbi:unnamed protein product [Diatraea saccharalis]|uniref:Uncharacterized protein n=1 Tax=Diatraea saccharalis TaxID=40085 RepID=A0A9N9RB66_9NEOP|nr:unnamed protein product [Diatraea saccharalis]
MYIDLIRILKVEEGEGPVGRKSVLLVNEMADMVGYSFNDEDHPVLTLEKTLKERNFDEDAVANASFLQTHLQKLKAPEDPSTPPLDVAESLPPPETLVAQFSARIIYTIGEPNDERLTSSYWLNVPSVGGDDDVNDNELVSCDIMEIARGQLISAGGAEGIVAAVRRLAGCVDARPDPPQDDKRPPVALSLVREVDAFRSRPPNTSRPPSLHVDDFTALHTIYTPMPMPMNRGRRAGADRGRFASAAPVHTHYRHIRGRGAWEMGVQHFGHFAPSSQYMMGGAGWGGGRLQRGPRHRSFMR